MLLEKEKPLLLTMMTLMYSQQVIEEEVETKECKSPYPSSAEMCIEICA